MYIRQRIAASIDRAGVRPFPLHNQPINIMTSIAAKQKTLTLTLNFKRDLAQHSIGKERAALFRHYRVAARKQRPDVYGRVTRGNLHSVPVFHRDNGR